jgi:hypothetical protein
MITLFVLSNAFVDRDCLLALYLNITFIPNSDVFNSCCELYVTYELWLLNQYDLGCMLVGLKSLVISRNLGLYGLKFGKLSASVEDFLT